MVDLYGTVNEPLSSEVLCRWHRMVMAGRTDVREVGRYRTTEAPMQVVSGAIGAPNVHFEAPPSTRVPEEIGELLAWFARTASGGPEPLSALTRAGIAHLYFESIHPFEDGNGRIGRAIAEKALLQGLGQPIFIGLAHGIPTHHRAYYEAPEAANKQNEITGWLSWFSSIALEAQKSTTATVEFLIEKTKLFDRLRDKINERQSKALLRMFREGPKGFVAGMSAGKYGPITGSSPATATRDLKELVELGAPTRSGERKQARYILTVLSGVP